MVNDYKSELVAFIDRPVARRIKKLLGGAGYITLYPPDLTRRVSKTDQFLIVIYHPDLKEKVGKLIPGYADWKDRQT